MVCLAHLIDRIAELLECSYVSDISAGRANKSFIISAIEKIDESTHPVGEWNEAISYVLGEDKHFSDAHKAREYMLRR